MRHRRHVSADLIRLSDTMDRKSVRRQTEGRKKKKPRKQHMKSGADFLMELLFPITDTDRESVRLLLRAVFPASSGKQLSVFPPRVKRRFSCCALRVCDGRRRHSVSLSGHDWE